MRSFNNIISSLFRTALRNIKAGFLQTFQYSNSTHFVWLSDVKWITVTAGSTPQGWIYPHHHCPLTMVWSSEVYIFCFLNFASFEALILSPIRNSSIFPISPPQTCAQPACFFPARTSQSFSSLHKDSTWMLAVIKLKLGVHVEFFIVQCMFFFFLLLVYFCS